MNRRLFLRGLGGACVAAPFLGSIGHRGALAQTAVAPRRLIVMFTHYGCVTTRWFPAKSHGPLTSADLAQTSLSPLAPYVSKLLMPRGIRAMNEWNENMSRGQGNDAHTQVCGSYFTCQPVSPNSNDPFSFSQDTKFDATPVGPSLDHVMAQQLSPSGTPLVMRVGNITDTPQSGISYSAAASLFTGLGRPSDVFASLTGLFQSGSMSPDTYQVFRGKSAVNIFRDDLATLERQNMSQADKNKLEVWKALLDQTSSAVRAAQCTSDVATMLGTTQANVDAAAAAPASGGDILTTQVTPSMDVADLYSSLAVLATVCNASPIIVLKYPPSYLFRGLGITTESESLSHRLDNGGDAGSCRVNALAQLIQVDQYYAQKFAYLVGQLDGVAEGDGTVLDNTAAVWFQEDSDGLACNLNNIPILQAGSCGGYFRTGWAINVEDGSADLSQGNSEIFCSDGGTDDMVDGLSQASGTDPKYANAPINKYYCNLMNALGVKAGVDGFPAATGTNVVTKFGMYDKTEDFIGGGSNPPLIHNPGEYDQLKA